jgi:hypothetical protein
MMSCFESCPTTPVEFRTFTDEYCLNAMRNSVMAIDLGFVNFGRGRSDKHITSESKSDTASECELQSESNSKRVHSS